LEELNGKVAVVTGGGSGIGRGMALAFAGSGMHVNAP
jgi:NAD(P)-dependent dehydrogenase (short-subunit alcohol dehydrogenase family)